MNRRGFERLDASHGLKFSCRARICQVHLLPVLNHRPSLYCLMSPSILLLACVAFMCCPPVSQLFSVCIAIIWSVLLLAGNALASSAPVRRSTVCCRRRCPLRRFCCLHVSPVLSYRLSVYRVLSPQLSSSSVLLLSCIARPQPPPVSHGNHALTVSLGGDGRDR